MTEIRSVRESDAEAIAGIYNHYIARTVVTFEEEEISSSEVCRRIQEVRSSSLPWFVAQQENEVIGYAYAGKWKARCAYRYSAEASVYVSLDHHRQGTGSMLYHQLLPEMKNAGIHVAIGGIALPNPGSIALHEKFGFSKAAHFKEVGFKFNRWIDVGYWQLILQAGASAPKSSAI